MAERRMFAKTIVTSDVFLDMPLSARCLYFTLGMFADDDGFVNNPKSIMRQTGASIDDLNILLVRKFVISFESGIIVIRHWKINNYLRNDRYKETECLEEKSQLCLDKNGAYVKSDAPLVYQMDTQYSIGKDSIEKEKVKKEKFVPPTLEEVREYAKSKDRLDLADRFFEYFEEGKWIDSQGKHVKNWKQKFCTWKNKNPKQKNTVQGREYTSTDYKNMIQSIDEIEL